MENITNLSNFSTGGDTLSELEKLAREGAKKMLQAAMENEVQEFILKYSSFTDTEGCRIVVKNGYLPEREIISGLGPLKIKQPRVDDRKLTDYGHERFSSKIIPKFMRRTPSIDSLIPILYLKGISTGDYPAALGAILGEGVKGLSATNIVRLKKSWEADHKEWQGRSLENKKYVYIWADGVYCNIRLENERACLLVLIGADSEGNKELIAVDDGYRESTQSWREILLRLKEQGLAIPPKLAIGDGALGFWKALDEVYPETKRQRCWVHKTANILDKMPKGIQPKAKSMIHEMYLAATEEQARSAYKLFVTSFKAKFPKAVKCLEKDEDDLFTFYGFPAEHWGHIRTTNPIESTFATVRLRTKRTKGNGSRAAALAMVWKLCKEAEKNWRKLRGYKQISLIFENKIFKDGELLDKKLA